MGRPRTFDSADTLSAISQQFLESGYAATSVDDLTECTGLGKGSLYGAFGNKHELYVRIVGDYAARIADDFEASLAGDDAGAMRRLRTAMRRVARATSENRFGCLLSKAVAELGHQDDDIDRIARAAFARMEAAVRGVLRQAQRAGDLDAKLDTKTIAVTLFAVIRGIDALGKSGASEDTMLAAVDGALKLLRS